MLLRRPFIPPNLIQVSKFHTSEPRKVIETIACFSLGHVCQSYWAGMALYTKCLAGAMPVTASAALTGLFLKGYKYDYLLNRKKLFLSSTLGYKASLTKKQLVNGPPVDSVNQLLGQLIKANSAEYSLQSPNYFWGVFVFENPKDWYDFNEAGQLFLSNDILLRLTKEELLAFLSIQVAHTLATHASEFNSVNIMTCSLSSVLLGLYAFFSPRIYSFPVDLALTVTIAQLAIITKVQLKYKSILLEADTLALKLAKKCNVNEDNFISLFDKLVEARNSLLWGQRFSTYCFFNARKKNMLKMLNKASA